MKLPVIDLPETWPPGSLMNFKINRNKNAVHTKGDEVDLIGLVISNIEGFITVWWPLGKERIKTYDLSQGTTMLNTQVIFKVEVA